MTPEQIVKNIRRATRKHHSAEGKIRVVLEGLRGEAGWGSAAVRAHCGMKTSGADLAESWRSKGPVSAWRVGAPSCVNASKRQSPQLYQELRSSPPRALDSSTSPSAT